MTIPCGTWKQRAAIFAVAGFIALRSWSRFAQADEPVAVLPLVLLGALLGVTVLWWLARSWGTARVDELGVTRKGVMRSVTIPWHDVRSVQESRGWRALFVRGGRARIQVPMEAPGYTAFHEAVHRVYADHMGDGLRPKLPIATRPPLIFWLLVGGLAPLFAWVGWQVAAGASLEVRLLALLPGLVLALLLGSLHPLTLKADRDGLEARWLFKRRRWSADEVVAVELASQPTVMRGSRVSMVGLVVVFRSGKPLKLDQRWVPTGLGDLRYAMRHEWGLTKAAPPPLAAAHG